MRPRAMNPRPLVIWLVKASRKPNVVDAFGPRSAYLIGGVAALLLEQGVQAISSRRTAWELQVLLELY